MSKNLSVLVRRRNGSVTSGSPMCESMPFKRMAKVRNGGLHNEDMPLWTRNGVGNPGNQVLEDVEPRKRLHHRHHAEEHGLPHASGRRNRRTRTVSIVGCSWWKTSCGGCTPMEQGVRRTV